jgi:hypothetical protein
MIERKGQSDLKGEEAIDLILVILVVILLFGGGVVFTARLPPAGSVLGHPADHANFVSSVR